MLRRMIPARPLQNNPFDQSRLNFFRPTLLCLASAILLILAFPKTDLWILSWVGLIPLMFALEGKSPAAAFRTGYFCGVLFFAGTLYWFIHMAASAGIPGFLSFLAVVLIVLY